MRFFFKYSKQCFFQMRLSLDWDRRFKNSADYFQHLMARISDYPLAQNPPLSTQIFKP